jgi:hypothetical protein
MILQVVDAAVFCSLWISSGPGDRACGLGHLVLIDGFVSGANAGLWTCLGSFWMVVFVRSGELLLSRRGLILLLHVIVFTVF